LRGALLLKGTVSCYCVVVAVDVAIVAVVVEASSVGTIEGAAAGSMMTVRETAEGGDIETPRTKKLCGGVS
jgi:hypothetical protein